MALRKAKINDVQQLLCIRSLRFTGKSKCLHTVSHLVDYGSILAFVWIRGDSKEEG